MSHSRQAKLESSAKSAIAIGSRMSHGVTNTRLRHMLVRMCSSEWPENMFAQSRTPRLMARKQ